MITRKIAAIVFHVRAGVNKEMIVLDIEIKTIPHSEQRYDTCGDYFEDNGKDVFRISDCGNRKYEALIAIHELVERFLCEHDGVTNEQIDEFDMKYEGKVEAGDSPGSPYRRQHLFASGVEKMLCAYFDIDWVAYDTYVSNLYG